MNEELEKGKTKAKRKLKALDFSGANAAVALVSESQGGPANGVPTLLIKAANFSDEFIEKASQVKVTMEITEFLQRVFGMYWEDAEVLARALGYTTKEMDWEAENENSESYRDYIASKVQSIDVMKQLHEAESFAEVMSNLSEDEYLAFLQDQLTLEKAFNKIDKETKPVAKQRVRTKVVAQDNKTESVEKSTEDVTSVASEVIIEDKPSVVTKHKETKSMTKEVQVIEQTTEVEVIAKSQFDEIQKQLQTQTEELQKALELVETFKKKEQEAIAKARKEELTKACGAETAEVIFKACGNAEDEVFADVVKALGAMQAKVESSDLFKETGASVTAQEDAAESPIAKALKARLSKQQ